MKNNILFSSKLNNKISLIIIKSIVLIILINFFFSVISSTSEAVGLPYAQIHIEHEDKECEVGLSKKGVVSYNCTLNFNRYYLTQQQIIINLKAEVDVEGWGASIGPPQLVLMAGQIEKNFKLFVVAPARTSASQKANVTITGNWITNPGMEFGEVEPNGVKVKVKPFYHFIIIPVNDYIKTWPTQPVEFELEIKNQGNTEEVFQISINDMDEWTSMGYQIELKQNSVVVPEQGRARFKFKVSGPQDFYPWKSHQTPIIVHISGVNSAYTDDEVEREWSCILYEVGFWIPEPCIFGIILVIVLVIVLVWAKRKNKLFWRYKKKKKEK